MLSKTLKTNGNLHDYRIALSEDNEPIMICKNCRIIRDPTEDELRLFYGVKPL